MRYQIACASHSWVRLKWRVAASSGEVGAEAVVYANGSGTGRRCSVTMYWPVLRCHQKSGSEISVENRPNRSAAVSASKTGASHRGAGLETVTDLGKLRG